MPQDNQLHPLGECTECGKFSYVSRKIAKNAAKRNHPEEHLSVYQCGRYWHYGHLDYPIMRGYKQRNTP
jgi:hypothetical protein